jgi:thiosulfate dehydrogenase
MPVFLFETRPSLSPRNARSLGAVLATAFALAGASAGAQRQTTQPRNGVPFRVPAIGQIKDTAYRSAAMRGRALLSATRDSLPSHVGNALRCASCHLGEGLQSGALTWIGSYARFPQYRARSGRVDLIEDRVNDCFVRSMNGRALDVNGRDMHDIVAYLAFLSSGVPVGSEISGHGLARLQPLPGDPARGVTLYRSTCVRCHGAAGAGTNVAPPLWGKSSYNTGAGMANVVTLASFVYALMPIDRAQRLTPQDAFDVATYINTRPRPEFRGKARDWPYGQKPFGADYQILPEPSVSTSAAHPARAK